MGGSRSSATTAQKLKPCSANSAEITVDSQDKNIAVGVLISNTIVVHQVDPVRSTHAVIRAKANTTKDVENPALKLKVTHWTYECLKT